MEKTLKVIDCNIKETVFYLENGVVVKIDETGTWMSDHSDKEYIPVYNGELITDFVIEE